MRCLSCPWSASRVSFLGFPPDFQSTCAERTRTTRICRMKKARKRMKRTKTWAASLRCSNIISSKKCRWNEGRWLSFAPCPLPPAPPPRIPFVEVGAEARAGVRELSAASSRAPDIPPLRSAWLRVFDVQTVSTRPRSQGQMTRGSASGNFQRPTDTAQSGISPAPSDLCLPLPWPRLLFAPAMTCLSRNAIRYDSQSF